VPGDASRSGFLESFGSYVLHSGELERERRGLRAIATRAGQLAVRTTLPETCAGCGMSGTWMCADCARGIGRIDQSEVCPRCGNPGARASDACRRCISWRDELVACRSALAFSGAARAAVHLLKYRNQPSRAVWCARMMNDLLFLDQWQIDILVPVPLHDSRVAVRGYNQSERIAVELSKLAGVASVAALRRVRPTVSQVGLGADERRANVHEAFAPSVNLDGLTVALVDDVVTTGSTLQESAAACARAGAECVVAVTFAAEIHGAADSLAR
jgi:competence protein ComFC